MSKPVKRRPYTSALRKEQAALTRRLIVDAAAELFLSLGYARTTIKEIASLAGVAPDTVYAAFGTKAQVLTAVLDTRLQASIIDSAQPLAVRDEPDQRRQLSMFAQDMAAISARVRPIFEVLRTAAAVEPEVGQLFAEFEQNRLANMKTAAKWIARRGPLKVSRDRAAEIIWAIASHDVARLLCDVRGWSQAEHATWLESTLTSAILACDPSPAGETPLAREAAARSSAAPGAGSNYPDQARHIENPRG
jgi:AcrR family transcriptional regulator